MLLMLYLFTLYHTSTNTRARGIETPVAGDDKNDIENYQGWLKQIIY